MLALTSLIGGERQVRDIPDGAWFLGRSPSSFVQLDFPEVSERHALLSVKDGVAILKDLNSSNGTLVNGELLEGEVVLTDRIIFQIGPCMFRVAESRPDDFDDGDAGRCGPEEDEP